jgi:hypothetical protein
MPDAFGAVEVRPNIDIDPHIAADVRHLKKEKESMATSCAFQAEDYCRLDNIFQHCRNLIFQIFFT